MPCPTRRSSPPSRWPSCRWGRWWPPGEQERAARQAHLQAAEADFDPLPFDAPAARAFGGVAASLRRQGRKPAARASDAMIAATAVANQMPIHTCNPSDFDGIEQLDVIAVPHPDHP